jgi:hypothetical protein
VYSTSQVLLWKVALVSMSTCNTLAVRWGVGAVVAVGACLAVAVPAQATHRYVQHRDAEPIAVGTQDNPLFVHNQPNTNADGGSWAWADYGLYQVLRATKPSPAAHAICQADQPGESIWIDGGMMLPGEWVTVSVTAVTRRGSDVDILVGDPDGSHGGACAPVGLVLRRVG